MSSSIDIFRKEVINQKQNDRLYGDILLVRPLAFSVYTALILLFVLALMGFLFLGTYSSRSTARGIVVPEKGVIKIYSPKTGIILKRLVGNGIQVEKGDTLFLISTHQFIDDNSNYQGILSREIQQSITRLEQQIYDEKFLFDTEESTIKLRISSAQSTIRSMGKEWEILQSQIELARAELDRYTKARNAGVITDDLFNEKSQHYLNSLIRQQQLQQAKEKQNTQLSELQGALAKLPTEYAQKIFSHQQALSQQNQRLVDIQADALFMVRATGPGRITSIHYNEGDRVHVSQPLLTIMPRDSKLEAELYVPTNASGFLNNGQTVLLRYEAFPYQRYGLGYGTIKSISKNVILPGEVTLPIKLVEPVYTVRVALEENSVRAYQKRYSLQAGMLLRGDIVREQSRIITWVLEPLFSLRGTLS